MSRFDPWKLPTLVLWLVFFGLGVSPEDIYLHCRAMAHVTTQRALTNSPWLLFYALVAYLGLFTFRRCREAGLPESEALGKAVQTAIIALPAFLPIRPELAINYQDIPVRSYQGLVLGVTAVKFAAWSYLLSVLLRYYLGWGAAVYKSMPSAFPSLRTAAAPDKEP